MKDNKSLIPKDNKILYKMNKLWDFGRKTPTLQLASYSPISGNLCVNCKAGRLDERELGHNGLVGKYVDKDHRRQIRAHANKGETRS